MILHIGWRNAWLFKEATESALIKVEMLVLHFTLKHNVMKFHICTDYLSHRNEKRSLLATKGQTLGNGHFLPSFLQRILIGISRRRKIKA